MNEGALESAVRQAEAAERHARKELITAARNLSDSMDRVAKGLEIDRDFTISRLGEIQGAALSIDRWCALLNERRDHLEMLRSLEG